MQRHTAGLQTLLLLHKMRQLEGWKSCTPRCREMAAAACSPLQGRLWGRAGMLGA